MKNVKNHLFLPVCEVYRHEHFNQTIQTLAEGKSVSIDGIFGSLPAALTCAMFLDNSSAITNDTLTNKHNPEITFPLMLAVCPDDTAVDRFCMDLSTFTDLSGIDLQILRFPSYEPYFFQNTSLQEAFGQRLKVLRFLDQFSKDDNTSTNDKKSASQSSATIIVSTLQSLLLKTPNKQLLASSQIHIRCGQDISLETLVKLFTGDSAGGYERTTAVEIPGEYSIRGGILDVFPLDCDDPIRIEFFGDTIDSIRTFSVGTQRSLQILNEVEFTCVPQHTLSASISSEKNSTADFDKITDHIPPGTPILYLEPVECESVARRYLASQDSLIAHQQELDDLANKSRKGRAPAPKSDSSLCFWPVPQMATRLFDFPVLSMTQFSTMPLDFSWVLESETVEMFTGEMSRIIDQFDLFSQGQVINMICSNETEINRMTELLNQTRTYKDGRLQFFVGTLSGGFRLLFKSNSQNLRHTLITADAMCNRTTLKRPVSKHLGKVIDSFCELNTGDYVVHLGHGIAKYIGVELVEHNGQIEEHLKLEFADSANMLVPVSRISMIQKYIGGQNAAPTLAHIGSKRWASQKERVAAELQDMASEMLQIQAARKTQAGTAFMIDTPIQKEFDECFPYTETPDQLETMVAINHDMSIPQPMDRLLCGDVGFGKTEIALRAAFRAVESGYQVAVLVPTTVLCEQHFQTFKARMAEFPVRIASLSRFSTPLEQSKTLKEMKEGKVDIVIGTHRVAQKDIQFANLGLVIIDEEQKFGVEIKEQLKRFRSTVDVLTMTATPIPRTLHFAMLGLRDISNLQTPPADRVPVETKVVRASNELIRAGIERELARKGQVFFVHNRVADIEDTADKIRVLVPDARVIVGHAQMAEGELEKVMRDFVRGYYDVLVCTTIVESGLDIPNANTIFIDEADRYGLANLHQLRGRVGRYKNRAYCYMMVKSNKSINPVAVKRLRAIEEFNQLGSGFSLAMRDLEIRGAGNILGKQQSGHIALIGYEMYCQLLEEAVQKVTGKPPKKTISVTVTLPVTAFLPDWYVPDMRQKMDIYRRLSRVLSLEDVDLIRQELTDRFAKIPDEVNNLLEIAEIKILAHSKYINSIYPNNEYLIFEYASRRVMAEVCRKSRREIIIADDKQAYMKLESRDRNSSYLFTLLKKILQ